MSCALSWRPVGYLYFYIISYFNSFSKFKAATEGLDKDRAARLLAQNGKNVIVMKGPNPILRILKYFFGGFCTLLWLAAIVSVLCYQPLGGSNPQFINLAVAGMLIVVICLQAAFSAFQDFTSSRVMNSIKNLLATEATVIRNGTEMKINADNLVVGDLVYLSMGNKTPADVRVIECSDLKFDNSMLTGER